MVKDQSNVSVLNCNWDDIIYSNFIEGSTNITVSGHQSIDGHFYCANSREITVNNSEWESGTISNCNNSMFQQNVFSDPGDFYAMSLESTYDSIFKNNTFNSTYSGIDLEDTASFTNTTFYHNTFKDIGGIYVDFSGDSLNDDYTWNITVGGNPQGNNWDAYCDKGSDSDGDGYADTESTSGGDYPFSRNQTSLFRPGDSITDWGPVYQECVLEVNLATGATTTSGASSAAGGGGGAAAAASTGGTTSANTGAGCGANAHWDGEKCICNEGYERISGKCVPDTGKKSLDGVSDLYGGDEYVPPTMFPKVANLPLFDAFGCIELSPQPLLDVSNNIFEKAKAFPKSGKDFDFEYDVEGNEVNLYIWVNNQVGSVCTEFDIYVEDQKLQLSKKFNPVTDQFTFQNLDGNSYFLTQGMKIREECPSIVQQFKEGTAYITVNKLDRCV